MRMVQPNRPILADIEDEFRKLKRMAERAMEQLQEQDLLYRLNADANSIAVIVKHLAGNMNSRFTDFLTSDGEKPARDRDGEFVDEALSREQMMAMWESGWAVVFGAIAPLADTDLAKTITIRGEPHSVFKALNRQTSHYAYHVGQIVLLAKHIKLSRGEPWNYLTIPRGQSEQFNQRMKRT
jgi:hypothetical protein